jgi:hypothetical protein
MWDYKSIEPELEQAGFVGIRRAFLGDSPDSRFREVENEERWGNSLGVECWKPGEHRTNYLREVDLKLDEVKAA